MPPCRRKTPLNRALRLGSALVFLLFSVRPAGAQVPPGARTRPVRSLPRGSETDRIIVKFRSDRGKGARLTAPDSAKLAALSARAGENLSHQRVMSGDAHVLRLSGKKNEKDVEAILARLRADPDVEVADPDRRAYALSVPNDPYYTGNATYYQWHFREPAAFAGGANFPTAWDLTTGASSLVVAVIDTGIRTHTDLASGRIVSGYDFIADSPTANDGDGRDSDPSDPGDWVAADECFSGSPADDSSWHGTHVAGIIGATTNNSIWGAGSNWTSKILPVRVLGKCGGWDSDIIDAMRWSAGLAVSGVPNNANPAKVINMSLGGAGSCDASYQSAVTDVINAGSVLVVAAGNDAVNVSGFVPANCTGVIAVAAVGMSGGKASYSNFGTGITLAAPGGDGSDWVWSTWNNGTTSPGTISLGGMQGTSQATPHVAGVASLMLSLAPSWTPAQIKSALTSTARAFPTGTGSDCTTSTCGAGIVDAAAAVRRVLWPVVNSALTATGTAGSAFTYTITGTNSPTSYGAANLPSGLTINTGSGVISGTPAAAGTTNVTITASNSYGSGSATLVLTVNPPPPVVDSALTASGMVSSPFTYTITGTNSPTSYSATGLPAGLSVNTSNGVISGTPTTAATTNVTIRATNAGGTGSATLALTISNPSPPVVNSALTASVVVNTPFSYTITGTNTPTSYSAVGLPAGLSVNTGTGLISGTPTVIATTNVTIKATNAGGTGSATLVLTVTPPPPTITSALNYAGTAGSAFSYTITANDSPTSFGAANLPSGLSVNTGNGVISGAPAAAGTTNVSISASNDYGTDTKTLVLTVVNPPVPIVTSALSASTTVGTGFSYTITASNLPQTYSATGLPPGVSVNQANGVVSGVPSAPGTYNVTIGATNPGGTGTATLVFTVLNTAYLPVPSPVSGVTVGAITANWSASDGNPGGTEYYAERATDAAFTTGLAASGWTTAHSYAFTGLAKNTRYYFRARARNAYGVESLESELPAASTLSDPPPAASPLAVTYSSITVQWTPLPPSPPSSSAFGYRLELSPDPAFGAPLYSSAVSGSQASSLGIAGLTTNTTYYMRVGALNEDGLVNYVSAGSTLTLYAAATQSVFANSGAMTVSVVPDAAPVITNVSLLVPGGAFPSGTTVRVDSGVFFLLPEPRTNQATLTPLDSHAGVEITAGGLQPASPLVITMSYDSTLLGGRDPRTLQIATYSPASGQWSLLPTTVDTRNKVITATTPHLTLFAPFFVTASSNLSAIQVFPQPWEIGDAGSQFWAPKLLFTNMPADADVRIMTITGEKVWEGRSSQAGVLSWDGAGRFGSKPASGTYLSVIESGGARTVRRVVIIR